MDVLPEAVWPLVSEEREALDVENCVQMEGAWNKVGRVFLGGE